MYDKNPRRSLLMDKSLSETFLESCSQLREPHHNQTAILTDVFRWYDLNLSVEKFMAISELWKMIISTSLESCIISPMAILLKLFWTSCVFSFPSCLIYHILKWCSPIPQYRIPLIRGVLLFSRPDKFWFRLRWWWYFFGRGPARCWSVSESSQW